MHRDGVRAVAGERIAVPRAEPFGEFETGRDAVGVVVGEVDLAAELEARDRTRRRARRGGRSRPRAQRVGASGVNSGTLPAITTTSKRATEVERGEIGLDPLDVRGARRRALDEHRRVDVGADDVDTARRQFDGDASGATPGVEHGWRAGSASRSSLRRARPRPDAASLSKRCWYSRPVPVRHAGKRRFDPMHEGGAKAIIAAFLANLGIAAAKIVGFVFTGSASMLAEAIHSAADTTNQGLLMLGGASRATQARRRSTRSATDANDSSGPSSSRSSSSRSARCSPCSKASTRCASPTSSTRSAGPSASCCSPS